MLSDKDILDRLKLRFKRASSLPELSLTATRLIEAIDSGEASAADLERIIMGDPLVAATFLRITSQSEVRSRGNQASIRAVVMRLGQKSVRSLAVSLALKNLLAHDEVTSSFNRALFVKHSLAVGFLARYLFARRRRLGQPVVSSWTSDELFAAGVLHDLCIALLAQVSPDVFDRVNTYAEERQITLNQGFVEIFDCPSRELGALAAEAWGLPPIFVRSMRFFDNPMGLESEYDALCCLHMADYLANTQFGLGAVPWTVDLVLPTDISEEFQIPEEEMMQLKELLQLSLEHFLAPSNIAA